MRNYTFSSPAINDQMKMYFQYTRKDDYVDFVTTNILKNNQNVSSILMDPREGLQRVKRGHFAFYCDESTATAIIPNLFDPHEICETHEFQFNTSYLTGVYVKKYSPLRERLTINFLRISEIGIRRKVSQYWNRVKPKCKSNGHFESVRIEYIAPIFLLLLGFQIFSIVILFCEKYIEIVIRKWTKLCLNIIKKMRKLRFK